MAVCVPSVGSVSIRADRRQKPLPPMPSLLSGEVYHDHFAQAFLTTTISLDLPSLASRPRATTPVAVGQHHVWSSPEMYNPHVESSPTASPQGFLRSILAPDDASPPRSFARPPKVPPVDPSHFPDPYPHRLPYSRISDRISSTLPSLSSAGSSSASTRSSAYTSSGSALAASDYGHVHIASGDDDGIGIAVDDVAKVLAGENTTSSFAGRAPIDQTRWSEYSASIRSRSSSVGHINTQALHENNAPPRLRENPSFDMGWQTVDERDEAGLTSGDETDDLCDDEDTTDEKHEERTSAVVVAEEGRALIVKGDGLPISQLSIQSGVYGQKIHWDSSLNLT